MRACCGIVKAPRAKSHNGTLPRNTVIEAFGRVNVDGDPVRSVATGG